MSTDPNRHDPKPILVDLTPAEFRTHLPELLSVYVTAMRYPRGTEHHRAPMWSEHADRDGWHAVAAMMPGEPSTFVGIAYGYHGHPHQWWNQQVRTGMTHAGMSPDSIDALLRDYFELTELHVWPDAQGHRIGEALLRRLLRDRTEEAVLLSTPELPKRTTARGVSTDVSASAMWSAGSYSPATPGLSRFSVARCRWMQTRPRRRDDQRGWFGARRRRRRFRP